MKLSEILKKEGIKIKKKQRGWYTFIGKNFQVDFEQSSCETTWWEVCLWEEGVDKKVIEHFEDYNHFDTKHEVVGVLYQLDKILN